MSLQSVEQTALETAKLVGIVYGLNLMLDMKPMDLELPDEGGTGYGRAIKPKGGT